MNTLGLMNTLDRRSFLAASASVASAALIPSIVSEHARAAPRAAQSGHMVVVGSANALPSVSKAMEKMSAGSDPLDAIVAGINIVEDDPNQYYKRSDPHAHRRADRPA